MSVVLVDTPPQSTPVNDKTVIYWNDFEANQTNDFISLPTYIEQSEEALRSRFLEYVYEVGQSQIDGKTIIERLRLDEDFSYWWLTLFALRRTHPNSGIPETIKLFALEEIVKKLNISDLTIDIHDLRVRSCIKDFCLNLGISCTDIGSPIKLVNSNSILRRLAPKWCVALATLCRQTWRSRSFGQNQITESNGKSIALFDYLTGFDVKAANAGNYRSRFWSDLPGVLEEDFDKLVWNHTREIGASSTSRKNAEKLLSKLNRRPESAHKLFESKVGARVFCKVVRDYLRLCKSKVDGIEAKAIFTPRNSALSLWPLFQTEWNDSLRGSTAIRHLILFHTIREMVGQMPRQLVGIYLLENQPWELILTNAWKRAGHGTLIGMPQAAPKFWEVRQFVDSRSRTDIGLSKFPQPDLIASTSMRGRQLLLSSGVAQDQLIDVEALSYQYLINLQQLKAPSENFNTSNATVTVLGDFSLDETKLLLEICSPVLSQNKYSATFKAHPSSPLSKNEIDNYGMTEFAGDLGSLLPSSSLVITTSFTSAAVDAYCLGIPLLLFSTGKDLNMSPLRLEPGVQFFHDSTSLQALLQQTTGLDTADSRDFFNLDLDLHRWRQSLRQIV
jgi:surface carbohydrate biosynthesis protein (TIGR04326 family)